MDGMDGITYVTCFMKLSTTTEDDKRNTQWRFGKFKEIAEAGIPLCVYTDKHGIGPLRDLQLLFPNIRIMEKEGQVETTLQDTNTWKIWHSLQEQTSLPEYRNAEKDTDEYLLLMNSKIEFVKDAMDKNPFGSTHFAWIDFNISHVFSNVKKCNEWLKFYTQIKWTDEPFLCMPGCCTKITDGDAVLSHVNWRFCGGFFIGDRHSLETFHQLYCNHFAEFLLKYKKLVWEVNFWAWLEWRVENWCPRWFPADHNDTIVQIPADHYSFSLARLRTTKSVAGNAMLRNREAVETTLKDRCNPTVMKYELPAIEGFYPGSASVVVCGDGGGGAMVMNTRYVNYFLTPQGYYIFNHPERKIITRNICSILDEEMNPIFHKEMKDPTDLPCAGGSILGVEDIRLFKEEGEIQFMATSVNYSDCGVNRIVCGKYDVEEGRLADCRVISPPNEKERGVSCEKNWVPLAKGTVIYGWSPFEMGRIENSNKLIILNPKGEGGGTNSPICHKFRGSSGFVSFGEDEQIGVVHFSENDNPRHYFHCLVKLRKTAEGGCWKPYKHSQPFYFQNRGIEFCIGFYYGGKGGEEEGGKYYFWVSQFDRDPLMVVVAVSDIPLLCEF
jgi:hypothetical protein